MFPLSATVHKHILTCCISFLLQYIPSIAFTLYCCTANDWHSISVLRPKNWNSWWHLTVFAWFTWTKLVYRYVRREGRNFPFNDFLSGLDRLKSNKCSASLME